MNSDQEYLLSCYDDNKRDLAKQNIEHMLGLETAPVPNLILFDRGYQSADFMLYLQEKAIFYLGCVSKLNNMVRFEKTSGASSMIQRRYEISDEK
ncbi:hypothetical protein [Paenibacillus glacialis]|uniref:hypothetical protein n=1 Tax=Paenibacillus glacialis TaxID=494026 RepID=UPI001FE00504|nr:hypothetical protein [Paenibacillus glacialis]